MSRLAQLIYRQVCIAYEATATHAIRLRLTPTAQTAALLFSEYICLAIMSFPYSYAYLGLVGGIILTVVVAAAVLYTSLVLWSVSYNSRLFLSNNV